MAIARTEVARGAGEPQPRKGRASPSLAAAPVLTCRIRIPVPPNTWMQRFGLAHPDVTMDVEDRLELGDGITLFEVRLHGRGAGTWGLELRGDPEVVGVEALHFGPEVELLRVFFRGRTYLPLLKRLGIVRRLPFPIRAGLATWTVTGPAPKVRRLLRDLAAEVAGSEVELVRPGPAELATPLLTARQREILERAIAEGYFDVPRRVSLTGLAGRLGVAASTLSVALAVIEKKIVQAHA